MEDRFFFLRCGTVQGIRADFASRSSCELPRFSLVDLICFPCRVDTKKVRVLKRLFSACYWPRQWICVLRPSTWVRKNVFLRDSDRGSRDPLPSGCPKRNFTAHPCVFNSADIHEHSANHLVCTHLWKDTSMDQEQRSCFAGGCIDLKIGACF